MASTNDFTAQAHLAAGMQKLEVLRRQFLVYLALKEHNAMSQMTISQDNQNLTTTTASVPEW